MLLTPSTLMSPPRPEAPSTRRISETGTGSGVLGGRGEGVETAECRGGAGDDTFITLLQDAFDKGYAAASAVVEDGNAQGYAATAANIEHIQRQHAPSRWLSGRAWWTGRGEAAGSSAEKTEGGDATESATEWTKKGAATEASAVWAGGNAATGCRRQGGGCCRCFGARA